MNAFSQLIMLDAAAPGPGTVILLGLGIVFLGLACIILLLYLMGWLVGLADRKKKEAPAALETPAEEETVIPNRGEFVAAVSAALAEELGSDITKIRIVSIRRL